MSREQAKKNLQSIGIAEPTEEQITAYLNQVGGETQREKQRADKLEEKANAASDLQKQLDEINSKGLTDLEKANGRIAELEKTLKHTQTRQALADKCKISGEEADKFFKEDGSVDFDLLGQIISTREASAAAEKEREILANTKNPGGNNGGADTRSEAEKYVAEHMVTTNNFGEAIKGYL